jgi:hypothetical protein
MELIFDCNGKKEYISIQKYLINLFDAGTFKSIVFDVENLSIKIETNRELNSFEKRVINVVCELCDDEI